MPSSIIGARPLDQDQPAASNGNISETGRERNVQQRQSMQSCGTQRTREHRAERAGIREMLTIQVKRPQRRTRPTSDQSDRLEAAVINSNRSSRSIASKPGTPKCIPPPSELIPFSSPLITDFSAMESRGILNTPYDCSSSVSNNHPTSSLTSTSLITTDAFAEIVSGNSRGGYH